MSLFGYIRPCKPELLVKEYDLYRSVYCGLCKQMGKRFGLAARLTLSYDATFLAMLLLSLQERCPGFTAGRCVVNPLKKCAYCLGDTECFSLAGAVSLAMTDYKMRDDMQDHGLFHRLRAILLRPLLFRAFRKVRKCYPQIVSIVEKWMQKQSEVERKVSADLDESADSSAQMLSEILSYCVGKDEMQLVFGQFGYFVGRWVYLIDAADDIASDRKHGNFNPFISYIKRKGLTIEDRASYQESCNAVLNATLSRAIAAFQLMSLQHFDSIIENILFKGMSAMQKQILFDEEK